MCIAGHTAEEINYVSTETRTYLLFPDTECSVIQKYLNLFLLHLILF